MSSSEARFEEFVVALRPRLLRALAPARGLDGAEEGVAEAFAYAWEHWNEVSVMENPAGYLYRVAQSRTRPRRPIVLPPPEAVGAPDVEPGLIPALLQLPETQRAAVWLVHGCGWPYAETAAAMGASVSAVGNHVTRGLASLRRALEVETHA